MEPETNSERPRLFEKRGRARSVKPRRTNRLPEWRRYLGLARFDLVEGTGASYSSIRNTEEDGWTGRLLPKIADWLGVPLDALYYNPRDPQVADLAIERLKFFAAARLENPRLSNVVQDRPEWQRRGRARPRDLAPKSGEARAT